MGKEADQPWDWEARPPRESEDDDEEEDLGRQACKMWFRAWRLKTLKQQMMQFQMVPLWRPLGEMLSQPRKKPD